ncbi:TPA: hypothetical protein DIU22_01535 [Candidatus Woesebacteria bacterium]|nr:hypothetical protein [Candidatus Woesebacteria bacterium]
MSAHQKPTIIWLHSHFLYWMGGTKFVYEVIKNLKEDYKIRVIVENSTEESINKYKDIGVDIISLNKLTSTSPLYWITLPIQIIIDYIKIKNILRSQEYEIIVSSMFPMNIFPYLLHKKHVQYCFEPFAFFHDPEFVKNFPLIKRSLIRLTSFFYKWIDVFATKQANAIITLNNTTSKFITEIYKVGAKISYAGIDTKHFCPFVSKKLIKKYKDMDIIVHSTDYTPVKGTESMIRIFAEVKKKSPNAHLLITSTINNVQEKNRLERITSELGINNNVKFLGFVDYDILPQIYSIAKVLVQCSFSERSGTTSMALPVKEAMACGTLCVRYPVKNEDVQDGVTGFLVDPRDTRKMVNRVVRILGMRPKEYQNAARMARLSIVNKYNWIYTSSVVKRTINSIIH